LQPNKTVTINGFITKRVVNNASRIDTQLTVTDLVEQTESRYTDKDVKQQESKNYPANNCHLEGSN
jgi:hypothetical protein